MCTVTRHGRWLLLLLVLGCFVPAAYAQRTVTLTLNTATIPDTTRTDSFTEVRGAVEGVSPITLFDGNIIDWSDVSTLEPENIGGDYWQVTFQIADTTNLTFKFYSQQAQDNALDGWEADPNPTIPPGENDTTLVVHFFEPQAEYRGEFGDRGPYDWRPWEEMEGMIAVWFRVAMLGEEAATEYDPSAEPPAQQIGVRGDNLGGSSPLDWGATNVLLQRESTNTAQPGYNIYSGVGYFPEAAVGMVQNYKFVVDNEVLNDADLGWEDGLEGSLPGNRSFTVPAQDTTLHWVYYGNTAPSAVEPVASAVIFTVDLTPLEQIGLFDRARGDSLWVFGDFNEWQSCWPNQDECFLPPVPGETQFESAIPITAVPGSERNFKFFLDLDVEEFQQEFGVDIIPSGWEEPITTQGGNRKFIFEGVQNDFQELPIFYFNQILPANVIPEGNTIEVTWRVDMEPATDPNLAQPFDPENDVVTIQIGDPFWAITQGYPLTLREDDFQSRENIGDQVDVEAFSQIFQLTDDDSDLVYEGTLTIEGPTYSGIQYRYAYGQPGMFFVEPEGGTAGEGRRRTRFISPNNDGSWPSTWELPEETLQPEGGPFPFESNPAQGTAVQPVDGEMPTQIALSQNYPNPFNPATTFRYSLPQAQHVRVRVFDVLGRAVATLVDDVQAASTYEVSFDGSNLASGVYFYQIETAQQVITKTMMLVK